MNAHLSPTNRILQGLPAREQRQLRQQLEPVQLAFARTLYEPGRTIRYVYFPLDCLISLLTAVDDRRSLEVGMVGNEGVIGTPFILGVGVSGVRALVQGAGGALRMAAEPFRMEFGRSPHLQHALYRHTHALMAQISQTAACNRFHDGEQRLARWLLMTRDRIGRDEFQLTHEFLARMLGLRRVGITEAASSLRRDGIIDYRRGRLRVLDARRLERASCRCYELVNAVSACALRR